MKATGETASGVLDRRVRRSPAVQLWRWGILVGLLMLGEAGVPAEGDRYDKGIASPVGTGMWV